MRSTEEFWARRRDAHELEDWLLSRQVHGSFRRSRAKSEERARAVIKAQRHRSECLSETDFELARPAVLASSGGVRNQRAKTPAVASSEEILNSRPVLVSSEDSGNSSLNTSTTDSRRSRRTNGKKSSGRLEPDGRLEADGRLESDSNQVFQQSFQPPVYGQTNKPTRKSKIF